MRKTLLLFVFTVFTLNCERKSTLLGTRFVIERGDLASLTSDEKDRLKSLFRIESGSRYYTAVYLGVVKNKALFLAPNHVVNHGNYSQIKVLTSVYNENQYSKMWECAEIIFPLDPNKKLFALPHRNHHVNYNSSRNDQIQADLKKNGFDPLSDFTVFAISLTENDLPQFRSFVPVSFKKVKSYEVGLKLRQVGYSHLVNNSGYVVSTDVAQELDKPLYLHSRFGGEEKVMFTWNQASHSGESGSAVFSHDTKEYLGMTIMTGTSVDKKLFTLTLTPNWILENIRGAIEDYSDADFIKNHDPLKRESSLAKVKILKQLFPEN